MRPPEDIDRYDDWASDKIDTVSEDILRNFDKPRGPVYSVEETSTALELLNALLIRNNGIEKTLDYLKNKLSDKAFELNDSNRIVWGKLSLDDLKEREKFYKIRADCSSLTEEERIRMSGHALLYHGMKVRFVESSTGRYVIGMIDRIGVDGIVLILQDGIVLIVDFEDLHRLRDHYQPGDRILANFLHYEILFPAEVLKSNGNGTYQIMFLDDTNQSNIQSNVTEADIQWDDDHKPLNEWKNEELDIVNSNLSQGGKKIETLEQYRNLKRGEKKELLNIISNMLISMYFSKTYNEIDNKVLELFKKGNYIISIT
jgi:hypothetical protein